MLRSIHHYSLRVALRASHQPPATLHNPRISSCLFIMAKRKLSAAVSATDTAAEAPIVDRSKMRRTTVPVPPNVTGKDPQPPRRQPSRRGPAATTNPNINPQVLDGANALRASPDGHEEGTVGNNALNPNKGASASAPVDGSAQQITKNKRKKGGAPQVKTEQEESHSIALVNGVTENATGPADNTGISSNPEAADEFENDDEAEVKEASLRPPPVNSSYLPLPWKGRLGYVRYSYTHLHSKLTDITTGMSEYLPSQCQPSCF